MTGGDSADLSRGGKSPIVHHSRTRDETDRASTDGGAVVGLLLVAHGDLGQALLECAAMIVGDVEEAAAISFHPGQGPEDLDRALDRELARLRSREILCFVDIPGGSPARAVTARSEEGRIEVLSGVNLPMLLEILVDRGDATLQQLRDKALSAGSDGIVDLGAEFRAALSQERRVD